MAYNKRNFYTKVAEIQDIVLREQRRYVTQKELFHIEIKPIYHISLRTFQSYLEIPAKAELEKMRIREAAKEAAKRAQLTFSFV